ncbi:unnamed protein product, partial [Rotaria sp. Silwood1]
DFDDRSPPKILQRSCFITNKQSPETRENIDFNHSSTPEDIILHKNFSLENNLDLIKYRTESRIEIIPKTNYKNQYPDYSNSPDTSCSSLSSQLLPVPLTNKSHISFRNDSNQLSDEATRLSRLSKISTGQASAFQIARRITELSSSFVPGQQEDPSEFLIVLLNHFMQCISSNDNTSFSTYLCNPLHSIFGINIKSSITCTSCQIQIIKMNYETIWSIPIVSYYNLQESLAAFCSKEKLTGDNALQCSQCHSKTTALQSLQLANTSSIIIIHLKRFIYDQSKKLTRKLTHFISYPEFLNIAPYVANNNASEEVQKNHQSDEYIYMLYAVVVHLGKTANNGHILVYIRSPDNLWYKINDELVTSTNPKTVFSDNNSYILWYTKLSAEKRNLYRKEINELFIPSSQVSFSSTPIHRNVQTSRNFDDCSPVRKKPFLVIMSI